MRYHYNRPKDQYAIIAHLVLILKMMIDSSSLINLPEQVETLFDIVILACVGIQLFMQEYSKKELFGIGSLGLLCIYSCIVAKNFYLLFAYLLTVTIKNVNIKKLLIYRVLLKFVIISIHCIAFFYCFFFEKDLLFTMTRNGVLRYDFFLGQPNTCQMYIFWTTLEFLFIKFEDLNSAYIAIAFLINAFFYCFTNSNTSFILAICVFLFIFGKKNGWNVIINIYTFIVKKGMIFLSVFFALVVAIYATAPVALKIIFTVLDKALTGRIAYGAFAYYLYGFTFWGQKIYIDNVTLWNGQWYDALYLDNAYLLSLLNFGAIYMVIISIFLFKNEKYFTQKEKIFIAAMVLYGITESYIFDVAKCFSLILLGVVYYRKKQMKLFQIGGMLDEKQ